ncbi:MAG: hypothetical protein AAGE43_00440 [Pseudomonadota bacterium]
MTDSPLKYLNGFSFKEKSLLISVFALLVIYGGYFVDVWSGPAQTLDAMLGTMIALLVALVAVHVIFHIVIALDDVEEAADERDRAIARRASVYGYNVLFLGTLFVLGRMLIVGGWLQAGGAEAGLPVAEIANLLLATLVLSEVVYYLAQLVFYRRGLAA